ncbi:MAG: oxidoreductase [Cyclobacteriaceae bacterium]|nr:MAG: oxidoreductase [Cyclobacteriaceae bacterium]
MKDSIQDFVTQLRSSLEGEVLDDPYTLGIYATDASIYQIKPKVVVFPRHQQDVERAIGVARQHNVTILPRGAGTSLAGQTVGASMVLDFSKYMNQLLELNIEERWVRVQPGIARDDLNARLEPHGLHFAPDPATSSRANVGGMVGNNSSGTKSILYGKTVDHILESRVLLSDGTFLVFSDKTPSEFEAIADGTDREAEIYRGVKRAIQSNEQEIIKKFPKVMRRVGGYNLDEFVNQQTWNLSKLICGSEGTLAATVELKLNLEPLPKAKCVCVVHYAELLEAVMAVEPMLQFQPSAVEILDAVVVRLSRENLTTKRHSHFIEADPAAILIVEFYGDSEQEVLRRAEAMVSDQKAHGFGYAYPIFSEGPDYEDVWVIRKKGLGLMLGLKGKKKPLPFIEDAGIPSACLPEYIDQVLKVCKKHNAEAAMYAHASVGVIHVRPILDLRNQEDILKLKNIAEDTFELVKKYGGSWSGEHGDGLVRSAFNERFFGNQLYNAFIDIKKLFDPQNLMNPGKITEAQSIEENLRYGTTYHDQPLDTEFKYRQEGSFHESVHMCTGVGECRKLLGGTMCPSFKATRDEEHSTRGRANALRMAMSGQFSNEGITSERLHQVMDLCLSCKACKSECPSNVDMAKMKADISQKYYDVHGTTLRDRMIRDASDMSGIFSGWPAGLINGIQNSRWFRRLLSATVGFDHRRKLPEYASEPFHKWFERRKSVTVNPEGTVVLFADTYLNYHEPKIGIAATKLLEALGYEVKLANVGCCQRPRISHGFLRDAKKHGTGTVNALKHWMDAGYPIIVCEPSCASALNDDLPDLIDNQQLAAQLKNQIVLIDDFVAKALKSGRRKLKVNSESMAIHGHCHQKALYGTGSMHEIFQHTGASTREIPSGCCGMAGSFGYEREHYDLSGKIGDEVLFPAVEKLKDNSTIVANGFSCRHQIEHFTGVKAMHWVETILIDDNN